MDFTKPLAYIVGTLALLYAVWHGLMLIEQHGYDRAEAIYTAQMADLRRAATEDALAAQQRARAAEQKLSDQLATQNAKDAHNAQALQDLNARLRAALSLAKAGWVRPETVGHNDDRRVDVDGVQLAHEAKQARQPADSTSQSALATPTDGGRADTPAPDWVLPAGAAGVLADLMQDADRINAAYTSCWADSRAVRAGRE